MSSPSRRAVLRGLALAAAASAVPLPALAASPASALAASPASALSASPAGYVPPLRQMRGMWIASVVNINWPSRTGLTPEQQQAEFTAWLDLAVARRLNSVFVQIRPTADAFWPSPYEPWSQYLTGVQGQDPGYDPLGFAVEAAHRRGLAFHAWFNPYRVSMQADPAKLHPGHPGRRHPEWIVPYGGKLYYNPGIPEVRAFVQDAMMDAVTRYDIDGVHFDDYFYPVNTTAFDDSAAYAAYGAGFPDLAAWRRGNVDLLVREMQQRVRQAKPEVIWGIGPSGIWRNEATDPLGSDTSGGQSYDNLHADTRGWVKKGWLDYIAPQLYWYIGQSNADYAKLVPWWSGVTAGTGVQLWIGQAAYKAGTAGQPDEWFQPDELSRHLTLNRDHPEVGGDIWYNAADVRDDRLGSIGAVVSGHYTRPALAPLLPRLAGGEPPRRPVLASAHRVSGGVELQVEATGPRAPFQFAVFRFDRPARRQDFADAAHLVAVVPAAGHVRWVDPDGAPGHRYHVTAVDRASRHSEPSRERRVR
ncbi:glycoside hydrolase family 10 protein [Microbispora bryophytorum]|uniref:Glycosyl hydrolase n=1 Tax=Microbispora bryophytorum TaxID=1460882 RepID=A0A8H9GW83_9ACTN|nr:family 10 glycosylhydrolase [Microbispora bryophytorum]MBD3136358.1 family 10 glycosylhydrolase [Microbispora bryophytorum]TQS08078.1 family 10 glycosylhydrolase [Microbispora bryophytorum]GGO05853.1 glycosyl hydrolase [Microbispora bryophytorum]